MTPDPLQPLRHLCTSPSAATRWACILEATAPKAGNVFPGRSFEDLCHSDFVVAAELTSQCFNRNATRISERMLNSITQVHEQRGTNVNLGIVLLLGPLVAADESMHGMRSTGETVTCCSSRVSVLPDWIAPVRNALDQFDSLDGSNIFRAIEVASAGGLGTVEKMDVNQAHQKIDILEAMVLARDHDQIATQYSTGFEELILDITPILLDSIRTTGDVLHGICHAQIRLLARSPDTLIARKNGKQVAHEVQSRAKSVDPLDATQVDSLDKYLRSNGHRLNPGTTADLLAASLYLLLRTNPMENDHE